MNVLLIAAALALPFAETTVEVEKDNTIAEFAAQELNTIVKEAAGCGFEVKEKVESKNEKGQRSIFIFRDDSYANEESAVFEKDGDLYLVGGGQLGCLYAVYDFLEDNLNFRHYFTWDDGFVVDKVDEVKFSGNATRKRPAFHGFRKDHHDDHNIGLFETRNRMNTRTCEKVVKGYVNPLSGRIPGHGFNLLIPPDEPGNASWGPLLQSLDIHGEFDKHPEWFSLGEDGKRHKDMQLCLSNQECREQLLVNLIKWIKRFGPGIYMVGSNDNHNTRYCNCEECIAKEKKYGSIGGPLWDWILWACPELEKRGYKDAIITSLAYKGWRQTEIAPSNVEKMPDNFCCDAAFLNSDRELAWAYDATTLDDGSKYNRLENLKKWCKLCKHVSYWYYGGNNPAQVYDRITKEIRELYEAGVESVGACGTGGAYEFEDFTHWIFARLLRDPYCDLEPDLKRIFEIRYGPAAKKVREYVDLLNASRLEAIKTIGSTVGTDPMYTGFSYQSGEELWAMRKVMDEALELVKGTPYETNVQIARIGINVWTVMYLPKLRAIDPVAAAKIDCAALEAESVAAGEAEIRQRFKKAKPHEVAYFRKTHSVERYFADMMNYANLKDNSLPPELKNYPAEKIQHILPPKSLPMTGGMRGMTSYADPQAASSFAWMSSIDPTGNPLKEGSAYYEIYDAGARKWLIGTTKGRIPISAFRKGEYSLVKLCQVRIPSTVIFVFEGIWGADLAIRQPARLFDPTYANKEWEIWASVKGDGPRFFADADPNAESHLWIDQLFCIDMGVPDGK